MEDEKQTSIHPIDSSTSTANIFAAFIKAQAEFPVIPKDSEVEVKKDNRVLYTYKYSDLTTIISHTRPSLAKYGIGFTQNTVKHRHLGNGIATFFIHESGENFISGFVPCNFGNNDMKQVAGQFTYSKRISLTAALGISADEDLDAAALEAQKKNDTKKMHDNKMIDKAFETMGKNNKPIPNEAPPYDPNEYFEGTPFDEEMPQVTVLDELYALVKRKRISVKEMPEIIKIVVGTAKKSVDLDYNECQSVIKYINLSR